VKLFKAVDYADADLARRFDAKFLSLIVQKLFDRLACMLHDNERVNSKLLVNGFLVQLWSFICIKILFWL